MFQEKKSFRVILLLIFLSFPIIDRAETPDKSPARSASTGAVLWKAPQDIGTRDLLNGPGGRDDAPTPTVTFLKEDMNGSNAKIDVQDQNGVKWKVKLGEEARPETVAARLVWAVGYFTNEEYFLPELHVQNMPAHLLRKRVRKVDFSSGVLRNVRLKRDPKGTKKIDTWEWRDNPFTGTREFNGLRVMMALINNWDVTDINTAVYEVKDGPEAGEKIYVVSDLGASFGTTGRNWPNSKSKGNIVSYRHSKFIRKITPKYVDFNVPTRPALITLVSFPEFFRRIHLRWIGRGIPRADARWVAQLLTQLSAEQVRDAFRAAGYSPEEVREFAAVLQSRIGELNEL